jgi:hypothetical protein
MKSFADNRAPVASYIITNCPKCDHDVNHVVVAHDAGGYVARVRCIVCNSEHKYAVERTGVARLAAKSGTKAKTAAVSKNYLKLLAEATASAKNKVPVPYSMSEKFAVQTLIKHPIMGDGVVIKVMDTKIEVLFADGIKLLVHSKAV